LDFADIANRVGRLTLAAPVAGEVTGLSVHTLGGYVQPGAPLMRIVPDGDRLTVEATVTNRDIGFIEIGQRAAVKVDAFNYMRYGSIEGTIVSLSADAVVPQDANNAGRCCGRGHDRPAGGPADAVLHGADRDRTGTSDCGRQGGASGAGHVRDGRPADGRETGARIRAAAGAALCK
tara:strand:+ start:534 stop:1064 length:531 start_codon:yes stop_codon:yes gene_type:complete